MTEWQPIETARKKCVKKGGKRLLVYFPDDEETGWRACVCEAFWMEYDAGGAQWSYAAEGEYRAEDGIDPSHWMPLPEPPK